MWSLIGLVVMSFAPDVAPACAAGRERAVVALRHADAEDIAETLGALALEAPGLEDKMTIVAEPITQSVVLCGTPDALSLMQRAIAQLDRFRPDVWIEARLVEVRQRDRVRGRAERSTDVALVMAGAPIAAGVRALDAMVEALGECGDLTKLAGPAWLLADHEEVSFRVDHSTATVRGGCLATASVTGLPTPSSALQFDIQVEVFDATRARLRLRTSTVDPRFAPTPGAPTNFRGQSTVIEASSGQPLLVWEGMTDDGYLVLLLSAHVLQDRRDLRALLAAQADATRVTGQPRAHQACRLRAAPAP